MPRDENPDSERRPRRDRGERTGRPAKPFVRGSRPPRPAGAGDRRDRPDRRDRSDRPARSFDRDRPARAPRDGDRRDRPARSFDRGRPARAPRRDDRDRGPDTRTDAQRRSDDVKRKTGGRRYGKDPYPPAKHTRERWQDEGSTRKPSGGRNSNRAPRRDDDDDRLMTVSIKNVEPGDANKIKEQLGATADRAIERLARALHAFEAHRYSESRKLIMPLLSQVVGLAIVHEVAGLSMYRLGRWQDAADQLEIARGIKPGEVVNHPVLADCYRALRRYEKVTELWESMKLLSPPAALLAEGRIVAAGALADQGELQSAVRMMTHGTSDPHKVQEHHLREWYVLADLYDRAGDVASARRLFLKIQNSDPKFADVADRLNTLGE
jgi:tetratricopeptide (TPR) repeat protein